eukprot:207359-Alexandrium_andersonii.AAC.1
MMLGLFRAPSAKGRKWLGCLDTLAVVESCRALHGACGGSLGPHAQVLDGVRPAAGAARCRPPFG